MPSSYWLVKSEPSVYSWQTFEREGSAVWDGVRSYEARNNLRAMKAGDLVLFYHSNEGKDVVGVARVRREAYDDPTAEKGEDWSVVELEPVTAIKAPVTLEAIKAKGALAEMALVKKSRLSVSPVRAAEFKAILSMGKTKLP